MKLKNKMLNNFKKTIYRDIKKMTGENITRLCSGTYSKVYITSNQSVNKYINNNKNIIDQFIILYLKVILII